MTKTTALAFLAMLISAPIWAQDKPPSAQTEQDVDTQSQLKAEQETTTPPPATDTATNPTTTETPTTSNDAAAAMQSTTGVATAPTATAVLPQASAQIGANVTVTSHPGNSISSNYHVDFAALDKNGDGVLSHSEVNTSGNPDLIREFVAVDINHNGRLSKDEMKGWMN